MKTKRQPLAKQVKLGLAKAFCKFNEFQLARYSGKNKEWSLKDALFMVHAKPKDDAQADLWKRLINDELKTPDTWEVELSASKDKLASWTRLLKEKKLGGLALLRNLRNMIQAGVDRKLIKDALKNMSTERILPFRFISAANHASAYESDLEDAMFRCLADMPKLKGHTTLLVDVSGSMGSTVSSKSDISRLDAACGLAMLAREIGEDVSVYTFSNRLAEVAPRRGFALKDAIVRSQPHSGTSLGLALRDLTSGMNADKDRLIIITDEQSRDDVSVPKFDKIYVINVATYQNGVLYNKNVTHISGWSEAIMSYIQELEKIS